MKEFIIQNKKWIAVLAIVFFLITLVVYYGDIKKVQDAILKKDIIIKESPAPRIFESAKALDGRTPSSAGENVPVISDRNTIIESGKTLKESYFIAETDALLWSRDAKLVYIRSLGTVTMQGISSGWEVVFGSKEKKKGYVIAVVNGAIASRGEVAINSSGYDLPKNWFDADEALKAISTLSQFKDVTISGINFYNEDSKHWGYAVSHSKGTESIPVR